MRDRFRLQPVVETQGLNLAKQFDPGSSVLGYVEKACSAFFVVLLGLLLLPTAALATVYTFSGTLNGSTFPTCIGGWSQSGTIYTCGNAISLASADSISPTNSIIIVANLITSSSAITVSNTSITGSLTSGSGAIKLTNVAVTGSLDTNGIVTLFGGDVSGDVTGRNGITTTGGTMIGGNADAATGPVSLAGGRVTGSVHSGSTVTTNKTNVGKGISSSSSTITISGGTILGDITTTGGTGIEIKNHATVTATRISAGTNPVKISDSTVSGAILGAGTTESLSPTRRSPAAASMRPMQLLSSAKARSARRVLGSISRATTGTGFSAIPPSMATSPPEIGLTRCQSTTRVMFLALANRATRSATAAR